MIKMTVTFKNWLGGTNTTDHVFKTEKEYDDWWDKINNDHSKGKLIAIHVFKREEAKN